MNEQLEKALQWAFATPGRIQQHEWELRTFLDKVQAELKPKRTVELGSWKGTTAALLSLVTSELTISLDIDEYGGKDEARMLAPGRNLIFRILNGRSQATAVEVMQTYFGPDYIDLLFLDDGHRIEEVSEEYDLWKPIVATGGWIVFHDINPDANKDAAGNHPDICQAHVHWASIKGNKEEIVFRGSPPGPGIGILRV